MYRVLYTKLLPATQQKVLVEDDFEADDFQITDVGALVLFADGSPIKAIPPGLWADVEYVDLPTGAGSSLITP